MQKINTSKYSKIIKSVSIDDRENDRINFAMEHYAPLNPIVERLDIADYIFTGYNDVQVAVEYKTESDFLTSIEGNHLHNQVYRMIHEFDYNFIMIESEDLNKACSKRYYQTGLNVTVQQINGAISELNNVCTVLNSQTAYGAFDLMMRSAGKVITQKPFLWKYGKKSSNTALNYLNSIHGLNNKANDIVNTLGLKNLNDLNNLTVDDLCSVNGIGKVTAEMIMGELGL